MFWSHEADDDLWDVWGGLSWPVFCSELPPWSTWTGEGVREEVAKTRSFHRCSNFIRRLEPPGWFSVHMLWSKLLFPATLVALDSASINIILSISWHWSSEFCPPWSSSQLLLSAVAITIWNSVFISSVSACGPFELFNTSEESISLRVNAMDNNYYNSKQSSVMLQLPIPESKPRESCLNLQCTVQSFVNQLLDTRWGDFFVFLMG